MFCDLIGALTTIGKERDRFIGGYLAKETVLSRREDSVEAQGCLNQASAGLRCCTADDVS